MSVSTVQIPPEMHSIISAIPPTATILDVRSGDKCDVAAISKLVDAKSKELGARGIGHGDRVVVASDNALDYVISILGCWIGGFVAVAVNPDLSADEQRNVVSSTEARVWIGKLKIEPPLLTGKTGEHAYPLGLDEPALILMTSGTTGSPKGIVHSLRGLFARLALNQCEIGPRTLRETLCVLPIFFGHGLIGNVLTPLFAGGSVHLLPTPDMSEIRDIGTVIADQRISFMSSVPSFWKIALRVADAPRKAIERLHVGSAPLSTALWNEVADWAGTKRVFNMFGMTETANWISGGSLEDPACRDGYVGCIWGGRFAVRDDAGNIVPSGRGEVLVQTPSIMTGYWGQPELQGRTFDGYWFRTGDIGELDSRGKLALVGRLKSEINRGGIKIQAEEIDALLERHHDIVEACAFGMPDPIAGEVVGAAVVLKRGVEFDPDGIRRWCLEHVRPDAVPVRIEALASIPRNDRGKVVRNDVRRAVENSADETS